MFSYKKIQIRPNASEWLTLLHIQWQPFHGGQLAGNECRKLLKNVDTLERLIQKHSFVPAILFIETFRKFNNVVKASSITPNIYSLLSYSTNYSTPHSSLGVYSVQATEALHHLFRAQWQKYKRLNGHPEYGDSL